MSYGPIVGRTVAPDLNASVRYSLLPGEAPAMWLYRQYFSTMAVISSAEAPAAMTVPQLSTRNV